MSNIIYVMDIVHDTIVDGTGFRNTVYCSFCKHRCKNCHNKHAWDINAGKPMIVEEVYKELSKSKFNNYTFSGGDPFFQVEGFINLAKLIKEKEPNKTIWIYSGFTYEEIISNSKYLELLKLCDVLVDGRYIDEERDVSLRFKGSKSQRIIDVQESLKQGKVIKYID